MKDVARAAGVSVHSVSAVLNGKAEHYRIARATQERIEEMARGLGYDPYDNRGARQMAARKHGIKIFNNVIAVCSNPDQPPVHQQPFESEILDGIEEAAQQQNMDVLICRPRQSHLPRLIEKKEVDGIIMLSSQAKTLQAIHKFGYDIVKTGSATRGFHSVTPGQKEGAMLATSHLIGLGHRRIAFIGFDVSMTSRQSTLEGAAKERFEGYCQAMQQAGLETQDVDVSLREHSIENGVDEFKNLWAKSRKKFTAVVCYNDKLAMGAVRGAHELGMDVPGDISVVGFDDITPQFGFKPEITSVWFDRGLIGKIAVEILMNARQRRLLGEQYRCQERIVPVRLEVRHSTAPPGKDS